MVRSKHRYITVAIVPTKKNKLVQDMAFNNTDIYTALLSKVKKMHGDYGFASVKTGLICKYCNEMTGVAVLKMRHGSHQFISTVLPFISEIGKENVQLNTIRTSSTLHQAFKHLKIYQQRHLEKIWNALDQSQRLNMKTKFENLKVMEKLLISEKQIRVKS